jgi:molecular chaperone GrpE
LTKVVKQLVTVLDTLELSRQNLKAQTDGEAAVIKSYCEIEDQLISTLKAQGIETVEALGTPFDPMLHEAVQQKDSDEYVEGIVCLQYQRGYKLGQKLIRPATVVVSAGPGPSSQGSSAPPGDNEAQATEAQSSGADSMGAGAQSSGADSMGAGAQSSGADSMGAGEGVQDAAAASVAAEDKAGDATSSAASDGSA